MKSYIENLPTLRLRLSYKATIEADGNFFRNFRNLNFFAAYGWDWDAQTLESSVDCFKSLSAAVGSIALNINPEFDAELKIPANVYGCIQTLASPASITLSCAAPPRLPSPPVVVAAATDHRRISAAGGAG